MNPILIYILVITYTIFYSIVEARHDYWVIQYGNPYVKKIARIRWHQWGFFQNALAFIPLVFALFYYDWHLAISLTIAIGFLFWQLHDSLIGYFLDQGLFYLGNTSKIDRFITKVFWDGSNAFIIRIVFFFLPASIEYFRVSFNL